MHLGQDVLSDPRAALAREWLLGNGLGGSASGTAAGAHTRPTHAHLIAAEPCGRLTTLLLKLEERLLGPEGPFELSSSNVQPGGGLRPNGTALLQEFRLDPWPVWRYSAQGALLEKSLFLIYGHNAVAITYRHLEGPETRLTASPLLASRDPHAIRGESGEMRGAVQGVPGRVKIEMLPGRPAISLWHNGVFMPARARQRVFYASPSPGGNEESEEAFVAGYVEATLSPGASLHVIASTEEDLLRALAREDRLGTPPPRTLAECLTVLEEDERERASAWRRSALKAASVTLRQAGDAHRAAGESASSSQPDLDDRDPIVTTSAEALRSGLLRRGRRLTLVCSLPGGAERGSETLRALAGLITLRGFETVREILQGYVEYLDEGLAPESFDLDDGTPRYGDPAPALWLVLAGELYVRRSEDRGFAHDVLYPALESVSHSYRSGTRHGVHVDADGLLVAGEGAAASKRADLNALWYHASVAIAQLARLVGRKEIGAFHLAWAREHSRRFNEAFWDEERGCLHRALDGDEPASGMGPGQLLAVSLPPSMLPPERAMRLVETLERELFTPFGLREAPDSARVFPAWLGTFFSAYLRAHERGPEAQAQVREWIEPLRTRLADGRCALLPEYFEVGPGADHAEPAGESVSILGAAELVRVWVEELDHTEASSEM